jgi:hypothetical protein
MTPPQSACACFNTCLQALGNLQQAIAPSFSHMTKLNAQAVEACTTLLGCGMCMGRPNRYVTIMTLASILLTVTTLYHGAIPPTGLGICGGGGGGGGTGAGAGTGGGGGDQNQWMLDQILAKELERLQKVFHHFSDVCDSTAAQADSLTGLGTVMAAHIGQAVNSTVIAARQRTLGHQGVVPLGMAFQ